MLYDLKTYGMSCIINKTKLVISMIGTKNLAKIGSRQTYGKLWCQNCGKEWAWSQRYNDPSTKCAPGQPSPLPPQWVNDSSGSTDVETT